MAAGNHYHRGPASDNFDGLRFFNPGQPDTDRSIGELLRWKWEGKAATWPRHVPVRQTVPDERVQGLRVTTVGHATMLIQAAGLNVLTDPLWAERASPLSFAGPRRVTAPGVAFEDLPPIDVVLLSHNHYDHLDIATLRRLQDRFAPLIVTPLGNDVIVRRHVPDARIVTGNWGDAFDIGAGAQAHIVPANHWSSRGVSDRRMALWGGFMLSTRVGLVYFAGDTGYGTGSIFRAMREQYGAPDLALIPIGAYEPRWFMSAQHVNPEEAVRIMLDLDCRRALGIHWGTFQLTDEAIDDPADQLAAALEKHGVQADRFAAARPGCTFDMEVRRSA